MGKYIRLSPKRKRRKAGFELKTGKRYCNDGEPKRGKNGQQLRVTKTGRAYRSGYLDAFKDMNKTANRKKKRLVKGAYNRQGRVNEGLVDDLHGPVVFFDPDFDFTPSGRIKGSYNDNGRFEPD